MLKNAETVADGIWKEVGYWDTFVKNTIGEQFNGLARQINAFAFSQKSQTSPPDQIREAEMMYTPDVLQNSIALFDED